VQFFTTGKIIVFFLLFSLFLPSLAWAQEDNPCDLPMLDCSTKTLCRDCGSLQAAYDACPKDVSGLSCISKVISNDRVCTIECVSKIKACDDENINRSANCINFQAAASPFSWLKEFASALFSWNSVSWDKMRQDAVNYWHSQSQTSDSPLQYFYDFMALLADYGSKTNLALLALSVIPLAGLTKLFALGNLGKEVSLASTALKLSEVQNAGKLLYAEMPAVGVAGVETAMKYILELKIPGITEKNYGGLIILAEKLAQYPKIANIMLNHEAAHLLGASEAQAYKITTQAFSALNIGEKLGSLGNAFGREAAFVWAMEKTFPAVFNDILQLAYSKYLFQGGIGWNIWRGAKLPI